MGSVLCGSLEKGDLMSLLGIKFGKRSRRYIRSVLKMEKEGAREVLVSLPFTSLVYDKMISD